MNVSTLMFTATISKPESEIRKAYIRQIQDDIQAVPTPLMPEVLEIVLSIALNHSNDSEATKNCMVYDIRNFVKLKKHSFNSTHYSFKLPYNEWQKSNAANEVAEMKRRFSNYLNSTVPISYMIWCVVCIILFSVSSSFMYISIKYGIILIPPWINLSLCIASLGLALTVIVAIFEWRKTGDEKR